MTSYPGTHGRLVAVVFILMASALRAGAGGVPDDAPYQFDGTIGVYAKYNSNLELVDESSTGIDQKDAFIAEPTADLHLAKSWGTDWWLDLAYTGHANFHGEHTDENWYFNRTHLSLVHKIGRHALNLTSELRHFTEPRDERYDFFRHTGILSYRRTLTPLWELRLGYESIITRYPETRSLNYSVNGAFVEARNTWDFNLSTYYSYDLQLYGGTADRRENLPDLVPDDGSRHTLRTGFDWLFPPRHALSGTYMLQIDRTESEFELLIPEHEGQEGTQYIDAEFDLVKHKATLLYSHRFTNRVTLSLYEEWIRKRWDDQDELQVPREDRTDNLLLSSALVKVRWTDTLRIRFRYLYRANASSADIKDYRDHVVFVGPEWRL